jgi:S-sulfo-L-cysteine synthase (3-phospho-L-serine-dependent)
MPSTSSRPAVALVETTRGSPLSSTSFQAMHAAREGGLEVLFVTSAASQYAGIDGFADLLAESVDGVVECDTGDGEAIAAALRERCGGRLGGVTTMAEHFVVPTARAARVLGLPGLDPGAAEVSRSKLLTRRRCVEAGLPAPRFATAGTVEEALAAAAAVGLPCVVKPEDEAGGIDVALCWDEAEVASHVAYVAGKATNYRGQPRPSRVLVEEYLAGQEISVETLTHRGATRVLGVTDKEVLSGSQSFIEMGHTFPSCLPDDVVESCVATATEAMRAVGFDHGAAHTEIKITCDGPRVIEINARPAGDHIADLVARATGVDYLALSVGLAVDAAPDAPVRWRRGAAVRFLTAPAGVVRSVRGAELARRLPGIVECSIGVAPGRRLAEPRSNLDRLGHVLAVADTAYLAARQADAALGQVLVRVDPSG